MFKFCDIYTFPSPYVSNIIAPSDEIIWIFDVSSIDESIFILYAF